MTRENVLRLIGGAALIFMMSPPLPVAAEETTQLRQKVADSIQRSVPFLEREGQAWIDERGCVSCHQVPSMLWSLHEVRARGFELNEQKLQENTAWALDWRNWQSEDGDDGGQAETAGRNVDTMYQLILGQQAYANRRDEPAELAGFVRHIVAAQQEDGSWKPGGQLPAQRRPKREIAEASTMWALLALPHNSDDKDIRAARARAEKWLGSDTKPKSTEWRVVRFLLEKQTGDDESARRQLQAILEAQNEDGGWGWLADEKSNAFGTGLALYAMSAAKTSLAETEQGESGQDDALSAAITRAWRFLTASQQDDGSWPVPSTKRAHKGKPQPTSTYWGSAWATIGLARTLPK